MNSISRRKLISTSFTAAAGSLAIRLSSASPNEKVTVAVVGVNGRGATLARYLAKRSDTRIGALCDVDQSVRERAAQMVADVNGQTPKLVADFRHLLDDKTIDALVLATPHHWHIPMALPALEAGKDLYLEKPASHVFREGRLLIDAAKKHHRIVQHGGQTRSSKVTEKAAEILASGLLGEIKMTKAWNIQRVQPRQAKPDSAPPPGVDYDMWLGAFSNPRMILKRVWVGKSAGVGSDLLSRGQGRGGCEGAGGRSSGACSRSAATFLSMGLRSPRAAVSLRAQPGRREPGGRAKVPAARRPPTTASGSRPAVLSCAAASAAHIRCRSSGLLAAPEKQP